MSDPLDQQGAKPKRFLRPTGMFFVGWLGFALAALLVQHILVSHAGKTYTGVTKFRQRTDAATSGAPPPAESSAAYRIVLRREVAGPDAVAEAAEELDLIKAECGPDGKLTPAGEVAKHRQVTGLMQKVRLDVRARTRNGPLISLRFTHRDPEIAEKMANSLVTNYIHRASQQIVDRLTGSFNFLEKQVKLSREDLIRLCEKKDMFQTEHAGLIFESPWMLRDQILRTECAMDILQAHEKLPGKTAAEREATRKRISQLDKRLRDLDKALATFSSTYRDYQDLVQQIADKRADLKDGNRRLREVRNALGEELARRRSHLANWEASPRLTRADRRPILPLLGIAFGGGLVFGGVLALVVAGLNRSIVTTMICLAILGVLIGVLMLMLLSGKYDWSVALRILLP